APQRVLEPRRLLLPAQPPELHPELDQPRAVDEPWSPRNPDPASRRALSERAGLAGVGDVRRSAGDRLGLGSFAPREDRARGERQPPFTCDLEAARLDRATKLGIGRTGDGLAVDLAGPEQVEILCDRVRLDRRRHHETEEHTDLDRSLAGADVGAD